MRSATTVQAKGYRHLVTAIEAATCLMVGRASIAVNQALVIRNWLVGKYIVEYEQGGHDRACYGTRLLERLATDLAGRGVKGCSRDMLERMRALFLTYPQVGSQMSATASRTSSALLPQHGGTISATVSRKSAVGQPVALKPENVLRLSWSHLQELLGIEDAWKRAFYENETLLGSWSVRQLRRQIESLLYERTGLSKNKEAVVHRADGQEPRETIEDLIRDPYVLEFAGLAERAEYSESDVETALLDHVQQFLLELGTGFCFEARQFRITVNGKHDRVDLVFYHRRLRCHVLLDLKIRAFRHMDAGQMNFYVNWFKARMMGAGDQAPVGIILCSDKDRTEVEFATAGMDNRLFVSRYLTALPSADQLKAFVESDRARLEASRATKGKARR